MYGSGISREVIELGVQNSLIEKSGSWYSYNGDRIGQGRDNVREYLRNNSDMASEIENSIKLKLGLIQDGIDTEEKKIDDGVYRIATRLLTRREFTRKKSKIFCSLKVLQCQMSTM